MASVRPVTTHSPQEGQVCGVSTHGALEAGEKLAREKHHGMDEEKKAGST